MPTLSRGGHLQNRSGGCQLMAACKRSNRWVRLLLACRDRLVLWDPPRVPVTGRCSPWLINGQRLRSSDPDRYALSVLMLRGLTHAQGSQTITPDGEALLKEWSE